MKESETQTIQPYEPATRDAIAPSNDATASVPSLVIAFVAIAIAILL